MLGRFDEAWPLAHEAREHYRELMGTDSGIHAVAELAQLAGDHEGATSYLRTYCEWCEEHGQPATLATYAPMLGRSLCALGHYDEAEPLAQLGRELEGNDDLATQMLWRQVQALVHASRGEHAQAERLAREAVAVSERTDGLNFQADALYDLAEVLRSAGRIEQAATALEQALERYQRKRNVVMAANVRAHLAELTAAAAALRF
jgi:tetratricopeptide (TPR) repeat protein